MSSIILVQNDSSRALLARMAESARAIGLNEISIVGASEGLPGFRSYNQDDIHSAMQAAISDSRERQISIINLGVFADVSNFEHLVSSLATSNSEISTAQIRINDELITFSDGEVDELLEDLSSDNSWPLLALSGSRDQILKLIGTSSRSLNELFASIMLRASIRGISISSTPTSFTASSPGSLKLSPGVKAALLRTLISESNIEDLFPNHPWSKHQEESAAAAYHAIAALFIKFNELPGAIECLALSDQFEDSPRSLALKGMIARIKGETLGAVANMVASLQQYELRKLSNANHFVRFTPRNIEQITDKLQAGLSALNRSDNERALECFAEAVYNFDPFYRETGLQRAR